MRFSAAFVQRFFAFAAMFGILSLGLAPDALAVTMKDSATKKILKNKMVELYSKDGKERPR